jgi:hypothetical protein
MPHASTKRLRREEERLEKRRKRGYFLGAMLVGLSLSSLYLAFVWLDTYHIVGSLRYLLYGLSLPLFGAAFYGSLCVLPVIERNTKRGTGAGVLSPGGGVVNQPFTQGDWIARFEKLNEEEKKSHHERHE